MVDQGDGTSLAYLGQAASSLDIVHSGYVCPAGASMTLQLEVKLVSATNICVQWLSKSFIEEFNFCSHGLNTDHFVRISHTFVNGSGASSSCYWGIGRQYNYSGNGVAGHQSLQTTGTVLIRAFQIFTTSNMKTALSGDLDLTATLTAATKSFVIPHESKENWKLRHWCTESDAPGGNLIYKRQVAAVKAGVADLLMPSWFGWLAKNVLIFCNGSKHHGTAWGEQDQLDPCVIHITVSKGGLYNVMVVADRADRCATTMCAQEVEERPEETGDLSKP